jgi:hypothetical protein
MVRDSLREQVARIKAMSPDMLAIEKRLGLQLKANPQLRSNQACLSQKSGPAVCAPSL